MIPGILATDTVDRVRPTYVSDHGRLIPDWSTLSADDPITECSMQPGVSDEFTESRENVTVRYTLFAPVDADIGAQDGIRFDGRVYQVDGEPQKWRGLGLDHMVALLVDMEG